MTRLLRRGALVGVALLSLALVTGVGTYLARTTAQAKATELREFDRRTHTAADTAGGTLGASDAQNRSFAASTFAGSPADIRAMSGQDFQLPWWLVLDAAGKPLGSFPASFAAALGAELTADPGFAASRRTGAMVMGNLRSDDGTMRGIVFQPYRVAGVNRYLVLPVPTETIANVLGAAVKLTGGVSYVYDTNGRVIAGGTLGAPVPDGALVTALRSAPAGTVDGRIYASYPVGSSVYRMVTSVPRSTLLASVQATERAAWQIFGAFALAMVLMLAIGAAALVSSARLARARMHDALTGLPNRALSWNGSTPPSPMPAVADAPSRCSSWTWTASNRSTTHTATPPVTSCCGRWAPGCPDRSGPAMWRAGSAATSSWCCAAS